MGVAASVPRNAALRHCRNSNLVPQSRAAIRGSKVPQVEVPQLPFLVAALDFIFKKKIVYGRRFGGGLWSVNYR